MSNQYQARGQHLLFDCHYSGTKTGWIYPISQGNKTFKTILIVDDEDHVRQSFLNYFEDHEWQVFSAESGESALELLQKQSCSAAVVDMRMGGMDGETFIRRAIDKYPEMAFVICTGTPEYRASEDILQKPCVADQVFAKPVININELEETINRLLANKT